MVPVSISRMLLVQVAVIAWLAYCKEMSHWAQWFNLQVNIAHCHQDIIINMKWCSAVQWPGKLNQNQFHNDLIPCYPLSCRGNCFLVGGALCWPVGWLMTWMSIQVQGMITDQVRLMGENSWPTQPGSSVIKMWGPGMCGMDLIEYWLN